MVVAAVARLCEDVGHHVLGSLAKTVQTVVVLESAGSPAHQRRGLGERGRRRRRLRGGLGEVVEHEGPGVRLPQLRPAFNGRLLDGPHSEGGTEEGGEAGRLLAEGKLKTEGRKTGRTGRPELRLAATWLRALPDVTSSQWGGLSKPER